VTANEAIAELFGYVGAEGGASAYIGEEALRDWPPNAVAAMKSARLLRRASPATSVVCSGCEEACVMPVESVSALGGESVSFVVCDKRDDINRVPVTSDRLRQWRCDARAVAEFVADALALRTRRRQPSDAGLIEVGIALGNRREQMLCVRPDSAVQLVVAARELPLAELVTFTGKQYVIDADAVRDLVDSATTADPKYSPSTARREVAKLETQVRHDGWKRAYRDLKKQKPGMSDVWYSKRTASTPPADGRTAATICRHMK
jgi:hypothetical protein